MTYKDLGDALFDWAVQENPNGTSDTPTTRTKAAAARCINGALRDIRSLRKNLFKQRYGWNIVAPFGVTFTSASSGRVISSLSPAAPNSGCTLRTSANQNDIHLLANTADSNYTPDVPYAGSDGSGISGTLYHDAVLIHRGKDRGSNADLFDSVSADVRFNRRSLVFAKNVEEVERRLAVSGDYGQVAGRIRLSRLPTGDPTHCWVELFNSGIGQVELRLRIAPLPSVAGSLEADLVRIPVELTASDLDSTTASFGLPGNMDLEVLLPFALKRWLATPFVKVGADKVREINEQYANARSVLTHWRGLNGRSPIAAATNQ